jgi:hypothetical protein
MSQSNFETAEVGDWFERDRGMVDYHKVVKIEETFGDRVRIVLESRSISTETDTDTVRTRADERQFEREFEPITDPRED